MHTDGSNKFIYSRFLTPFLANFSGWAIFADGDMVCETDICRLWELRDSSKAVQVVQHNYQTTANIKYLGNINESAKEKTKEILKYMNKNYEYYKNPTQGSIKLRCEEKMMYNCVEKYLKEKNIKFLISSSNAEDCVVISSNNFKRNFSITSGNYRRKKSGTSDLPIKYRQEVKEYLYNKFNESNFEEDKKKFFIKVKKDFLKDLKSDLNRSFNFEDFTVFLSKTENEMKFRIKKKSKTNGPTVIFSIDFHNNAKDNDLSLLKETIKSSK